MRSSLAGLSFSRSTLWRSGLAAVLLALPAAAAAQAGPSAAANPGAIAGGLINKGEAADKAGLPRATPPAIATPQAQADVQGPAFLVTTLKVPASRFLTPGEIDALTAPVVGRRVTLADLQGVVDQINALYAKRHVLTGRAFLPPQRVSGGVDEIALVEAKLGKVAFTDGRYTRAKYARRWVATTAGETLDTRTLQREIGRFNLTNDAQIQASLSPGGFVGTTDLQLLLKDPNRDLLQFFVDNNGYNSTGRVEGGVVLRHNRLLSDGDNASAYLVASQGSVTGNLSYTVPINASGGRFGLSVSHSQIRVIAGSSASLDIVGKTTTVTGNLGQPLVSRDAWSLSGVVSGSFIDSADTVSGMVIDSERLYKATAGLSATGTLGRWARLTGDVLGSGVGVTYRTGSGAGSFWTTSADFDLATVAWHGLNLHVSGAGVYTSQTNVPGTQLFQIGGDSSVRGYEPGFATGHAGYYVRSELHAALPGIKKYVDSFVFADTGEVWAAGGNHVNGSGAGVGFNLFPFRHMVVQGSYAHTLGDLAVNQPSDRVDLKAVLQF